MCMYKTHVFSLFAISAGRQAGGAPVLCYCAHGETLGPGRAPWRVLCPFKVDRNTWYD